MSWSIERSRRPEILLEELLKSTAAGNEKRSFLRARVLAYDELGGRLQNPDGSGTVGEFTASVGPTNPIGSIKARVLTNGIDSITEDSDARVFWPMSPHDSLSIPVVPGEHVIVMFEDSKSDHGLWLSRVSGQDDQNFVPGEESYTASRSQSTAMDAFVEPDLGYEPTDYGEAPQRDLTGLFDGG